MLLLLLLVLMLVERVKGVLRVLLMSTRRRVVRGVVGGRRRRVPASLPLLMLLLGMERLLTEARVKVWVGVVAPSSSDGRPGVGERRVLRVLDRRELMRTRRRVVRVGRHRRGQMLLLGGLVERTLLLMKWVVLHGILQMRRRVQGLVVTHGSLSVQRMMDRQRWIEVIPS